ncbi:hypothetical protein [Clostridium sp.]|uniref:hypothetical protein n=1 Tax=Clostridium sp. TaxID=1506 RepID=UPI002FCB044B
MTKHNCSSCCGNCNCSHTESDPTSPSYETKQKNKANSNSPYGDKEPSKHTKHK